MLLINPTYQYSKPAPILTAQMVNLAVDIVNALKHRLQYILFNVLSYLVLPLIYLFIYPVFCFIVYKLRQNARQPVTATSANYIEIRTNYDQLNNVLNDTTATTLKHLDATKIGFFLRPLFIQIKEFYNVSTQIQANTETALNGLNSTRKTRFLTPITENELWKARHPKYNYLT
jgi:uncharacterized membrane protein YkvI